MFASSHLQYPVGTSVVAVFHHKLLTLFRCRYHHFRIMSLYECLSLFRLFAHDDALWLFQHHAQQCADACRTGTDDEHGVLFRYLTDACSPVACCQYVAHEESLLVAHAVGNAVQSLCSQRHTHILRLSAVDAAAQCPSAVWRGAVVHVAMLAVETFSAERLHVHRHAIAGFQSLHCRSCLFHYSHHLMSHGDARHRPWHAAMLDVQVARTDATQRHSDDGVGGVLYLGFRFVSHGKPSFLNVCICFHVIVGSLCYIDRGSEDGVSFLAFRGEVFP